MTAPNLNYPQGSPARYDARGGLASAGLAVDSGALSPHGGAQIGTVPYELYKTLWQGWGFVAATTAAMTNDLRAFPFWEPRGGTLDNMLINITAFVAGNQARFGIYNNTSPTIFYPSTLLFDSGAVDTSANVVRTIPITLALGPQKWYWIAYCASATPATISMLTVDTNVSAMGYNNAFSARNAMFGAFTFGALPFNFPTAGFSASGVNPVPNILVRYGT